MNNSLKILSIVFLAFQIVDLYPQELKYDDLQGGEKKPKTPASGWKSYESKDGTKYKAGDKITIGFPSANDAFAYITAPKTGRRFSKTYAGKEVGIKYFIAVPTKNEGFQPIVVCKGTRLEMFNIEIENAIKTGEIKPFGTTSVSGNYKCRKMENKDARKTALLISEV